jgi:hypothetical protein
LGFWWGSFAIDNVDVDFDLDMDINVSTSSVLYLECDALHHF